MFVSNTVVHLDLKGLSTLKHIKLVYSKMFQQYSVISTDRICDALGKHTLFKQTFMEP